MEKLFVSSSPHLRSGTGVRSIMLDVIIALTPALIASVILFGLRALLVTAVSVAAAVLAEYISRKLMKRPNSIGDLSAVVTGMLLAFNLPVSIPRWIAALGSAIAIVGVKQFFGGIGQNFVNPALAGRIILMVSFPAQMTKWTMPLTSFSGVDAVTTATPLGILSEGGEQAMPPLLDLFFGVRGGCLGETCGVALLLGGVYLVARKVINPIIPICYVGTAALLSLAFGLDPLVQILSGGAIFLATDYATSPLTNWGNVFFGIGCGVLTMIIRQFGSLPEGVSFSIVLMNILVPYIDRLTRPVPFGEEGARQ